MEPFKSEAGAVDQWLRQWTSTQPAWVQRPLVSIRDIGGRIWPQLLLRSSDSPIYLSKQVWALNKKIIKSGRFSFKSI